MLGDCWGVSLLVGVGEWWKTLLGGFSASVSSLLNKLCLSGPIHFLAFPVLSHVSPLWVVSEQALKDQYLLPGVKPPQSS